MTEIQESRWTRMKREAVIWLLWLISTCLGLTVRFKIDRWDRLQKVKADGKGGLVLPWHGSTLLAIYYCRHMGFYSIASVSRDGELQNGILRRRGFETIRGSSARHGIRALLEAIRRLREGKVLAYTPDGPKGPPKKVQPGTVYMAQKSGCPVLPVGVACAPCKRLHSWDSHIVPLPFSRAVIAFGEPLYISADEDESAAAVRIEEAINEAEDRANGLLFPSPLAGEGQGEGALR
ncbi:MAG: lysophospholipid acyltransferase family protein [Armatimonadota bacterium]|nr:lysophospholipid acyltransferase family protein [bacterium]